MFQVNLEAYFAVTMVTAEDLVKLILFDWRACAYQTQLNLIEILSTIHLYCIGNI